MKLLRKNIQDNILISIILLTLSGIAMYSFLKKEILAEMQEQLDYEVADIHEFIEQGHSVQFPLVTVEKVDNKITSSSLYGDTLIYDPIQNKIEDYYYLTSVRKNNLGNYRITVMHTYIGWSQYSSTIFAFVLLTAIFMITANVLLSYFFQKKIWKPFFFNLQSLKKFSVTNGVPLMLEDSPVTEFIELKIALKDLADKSQREYNALREFIENSSHEMQTPLGIIQSKLDRMSQSDVSKELSEYIVQAKSGVQRLTRLNKSLLLLAKLDNNDFSDKKDIKLHKLLTSQLEVLEDLFASKGLQVKTALFPLHIHANYFLTETLINNLLSNAIRYTTSGNTIHLNIQENILSISNPGDPFEFSEKQLFQRFTKSNKNPEATGLGLSIAYQICESNNWSITYSFENHMHIFKVAF